MHCQVLFLLLAAPCASLSTNEKLLANPIRKVVTMLQDMQKTVEAEGEKEKDLFDKFMCYCGNGAGSLDVAIQTGGQKINELTGQIEQESAQKSQFQQDIAQHKADRTEAESVIKESTAMRAKEASEFAASSGEMKANVEAMTGALDALRKGLSASMLQTSVGSVLKNVVAHSPLVSDAQRETLQSFLATGTDETGSTDTIIGIVDQMKDEMSGDLATSIQDEETAKAGFATLMDSKTKEIGAAGKAVEQKTARVGELAVSVVTAKADLEDTQEALEEDTKFKQNLAKNCATKQKEWDERQKLRAQEVEALSETIKMLNDDDALDLFKKTLPSGASFLQVETSMHARVRRASTLLRSMVSRDPQNSMNFHTMLMMLRSGGQFDKVVKMVDDMVQTLGKAQVDDDKKRDFCIAELDKTEDEEKGLKRDIHDLEADIEEKEDKIATTKAEIAALQAGIAALDKSVVEATEQRKDEHVEYTDTSASNQAALELIAMAKNRMNKFYNPSQYKAPPTTTESSSPYGFVQLSLRSARADPGPAPETFGEYKKTDSGGVLGLMDQMIKDVEMDMAEAKHDEEDAQQDYEQAMKDGATKRSEDSKLTVEKEGAKAEMAINLQSAREGLSTKRDQLAIAQDKLDDLHKDCDFLLDNYGDRKKTRATEIDGLKESKSVLAGASFGLVQK